MLARRIHGVVAPRAGRGYEGSEGFLQIGVRIIACHARAIATTGHRPALLTSRHGVAGRHSSAGASGAMGWEYRMQKITPPH